jgi:hypothetical protein
MKVKVIGKENKSVYRTLNAVRIATRENPTNADETEIVVYSGGHGYAFNTKYYDVVITELDLTT